MNSMTPVSERLEAMRATGISCRILKAMRDVMRAREEVARAEDMLSRKTDHLNSLIEDARPRKEAKKPKEIELTSRGWIKAIRPRPDTGPARAAVRYNEKENADMLAEWADGKGLSLEDIASRHSRGTNGVTIQLARLGAKGIDKSWSY